MKRVLFIAEMNEIVKNMNEAMLPYFQVKLCIADAGMAGQLLHIFQPDIVLIFLSRLSRADVMGLNILLRENANLPTVVVGSMYEFQTYGLNINAKQVRGLTRPISNKEVIRTLYVSLGVEFPSEQEQLEKADVRKHILFIDDNPLLLRSMKALVEGRYRVSIAVSGSQALDLMQRDCPDMIFMAYEMPVVNGKIIYKGIRANPQFAAIPVVFLSSIAKKEHIKEILQLQPAGYILKPADKERILNMITQTLGK